MLIITKIKSSGCSIFSTARGVVKILQGSVEPGQNIIEYLQGGSQNITGYKTTNY